MSNIFGNPSPYYSRKNNPLTSSPPPVTGGMASKKPLGAITPVKTGYGKWANKVNKDFPEERKTVDITVKEIDQLIAEYGSDHNSLVYILQKNPDVLQQMINKGLPITEEMKLGLKRVEQVKILIENNIELTEEMKLVFASTGASVKLFLDNNISMSEKIKQHFIRSNIKNFKTFVESGTSISEDCQIIAISSKSDDTDVVDLILQKCDPTDFVKTLILEKSVLHLSLMKDPSETVLKAYKKNLAGCSLSILDKCLYYGLPIDDDFQTTIVKNSNDGFRWLLHNNFKITEEAELLAVGNGHNIYEYNSRRRTFCERAQMKAVEIDPSNLKRLCNPTYLAQMAAYTESD